MADPFKPGYQPGLLSPSTIYGLARTLLPGGDALPNFFNTPSKVDMVKGLAHALSDSATLPGDVYAGKREATPENAMDFALTTMGGASVVPEKLALGEAGLAANRPLARTLYHVADKTDLPSISKKGLKATPDYILDPEDPAGVNLLRKPSDYPFGEIDDTKHVVHVDGTQLDPEKMQRFGEWWRRYEDSIPPTALKRKPDGTLMSNKAEHPVALAMKLGQEKMANDSLTQLAQMPPGVKPMFPGYNDVAELSPKQQVALAKQQDLGPFVEDPNPNAAAKTIPTDYNGIGLEPVPDAVENIKFGTQTGTEKAYHTDSTGKTMGYTDPSDGKFYLYSELPYDPSQAKVYKNEHGMWTVKVGNSTTTASSESMAHALANHLIDQQAKPAWEPNANDLQTAAQHLGYDQYSSLKPGVQEAIKKWALQTPEVFGAPHKLEPGIMSELKAENPELWGAIKGEGFHDISKSPEGDLLLHHPDVDYPIHLDEIMEDEGYPSHFTDAVGSMEDKLWAKLKKNQSAVQTVPAVADQELLWDLETYQPGAMKTISAAGYTPTMTPEGLLFKKADGSLQKQLATGTKLGDAMTSLSAQADRINKKASAHAKLLQQARTLKSFVEPMDVYHGTSASRDIKKFDLERASNLEKAIFMTPDKNLAREFGSQVIPLKFNPANTSVVDLAEVYGSPRHYDPHIVRTAIDEARRAGRDNMIIKNMYDMWDPDYGPAADQVLALNEVGAVKNAITGDVMFANKAKGAGLIPAIIGPDGQTHIGGMSNIHADIVANHYKSFDGVKPGWISPDGDFLDRAQAMKWVEDNEPTVHENLEGGEFESHKLDQTDYGDTKEMLHGRDRYSEIDRKIASGEKLSTDEWHEWNKLNAFPEGPRSLATRIKKGDYPWHLF